MKMIIKALGIALSWFFTGVGFGVTILVFLLFFAPISIDNIGDVSYENQDGKQIMQDTYYNIQIMRYQDDVRDITVELVRGCRSNQSCYFMRVFDYLSEFDYVYSPSGMRVESPLNTIKTNSYDCKTAVVIFCSMMRSIGITCYPSISQIRPDVNHIIAIMEIDNSKIIVELTLNPPDWTYVNDTQEIWDAWWKMVKNGGEHNG